MPIINKTNNVTKNVIKKLYLNINDIINPIIPAPAIVPTTSKIARPKNLRECTPSFGFPSLSLYSANGQLIIFIIY